MKNVCYIIFQFFLFVLIICSFSFVFCSSVFNVLAIEDNNPTEIIKTLENPSELITEAFTEIVTEDITILSSEPTEQPTEKYTTIQNQSSFSNVLLIMIFVVLVVTLFNRYV